MRRPMYDTMTTLFEYAKGSISDKDMEEFASLTEHATDEALRLAQVCEGIACTVESDARGGHPAGSFHGADSVFTLLCALAHSFDTIAAMAHVGDEATYHLNCRKRGVEP